MLDAFLNNFATAAQQPWHAPVFLTVVYFIDPPPDEGRSPTNYEAKQQYALDMAELEHTRETLHAYESNHGLEFRMLTLNEQFSRGRGLEFGVQHSQHPDPPVLESGMEPVLFFCDVDMKFTDRFLYRCRANAIPGNTAYFPIPFSLFQTATNTSVLHVNGDWRKYGLGMVCISHSDFLGTDGYDKSITGWGGEDVDFYERLLKNATMQVMRSVDEGLIHRWHRKVCDKAVLTDVQMQDCIQSRAEWAGDKLHLGQTIAKYELKYGPLPD